MKTSVPDRRKQSHAVMETDIFSGWQGVALITHAYLTARLKKQWNYKFTPLVGLHGFELDEDI